MKYNNRKKWDNEKIDEKLVERPIQRITDCNNVVQPSTTPIEWKCKKCGNMWFARVDNIINKNSGCPSCAKNKPYTIQTLNEKLKLNGRNDICAIEIKNGKKRVQRLGYFECTICKNKWWANIHNVIKFNYGCPKCNENVATKIVIDGNTFHSKLEYYFWKQLNVYKNSLRVIRQQHYLPSRKLTCDFYFPDKQIWVEISGKFLLTKEKYKQTINEKQKIVQDKNEKFVLLTSFTEIDDFILTTFGEKSND